MPQELLIPIFPLQLSAVAHRNKIFESDDRNARKWADYCTGFIAGYELSVVILSDTVSPGDRGGKLYDRVEIVESAMERPKRERVSRGSPKLGRMARRLEKRKSRLSGKCKPSELSERTPGTDALSDDSDWSSSSFSGSESEQEHITPSRNNTASEDIAIHLPSIDTRMTLNNTEVTPIELDGGPRRHTVGESLPAVSPHASAMATTHPRRASLGNERRPSLDSGTLPSPSSRGSTLLASPNPGPSHVSPKAEDVIHRGHLVPISRASVVMHMPILVEHNTAQQLEEHVSMAGPVRRASMAAAAASSQRPQRPLRASTTLTIAQSHESSIAAALAGKEVGHVCCVLKCQTT